ncbi:hypothetical protein G5I_03341 [Acromyrmex echinatior]|uniref:Uncharacterized protein n=1 Tax=Acromyrmex echinatior TaxID=103372 RepID=F4WCR5_ACREC|nr:hypothetical protein G5I_03341 [Acromyrmex echinatior]
MESPTMRTDKSQRARERRSTRKAVEQSVDEIATESPRAPLLCSPGIIVALEMASTTVVSAWSENVENFGGLSAGFNAQRSVSTGSHGIITKSPKPHL